MSLCSKNTKFSSCETLVVVVYLVWSFISVSMDDQEHQPADETLHIQQRKQNTNKDRKEKKGRGGDEISKKHAD